MKFYITEETKQELETQIIELNKPIAHYDGIYISDSQHGQIEILEEILESSIVIPVEESWDKAVPDGMEEDTIFDYIQIFFKNGVIIQPKQ